MTPADLQFPFHVVANPDHLQDIDTTFSYQILIQDDRVRAICNDIPCAICPFSCKQGENRQEVLITYAKENFPEFLI